MSSKRRKPHGSPLTPHASGQWCKKIRGRVYYFGTDHAEALRLYRALASDLHAGRRVVDTDPLTINVSQLCNRFLAFKDRQREAGELAASTAADYGRAAERVVAVFGAIRPVCDLRPADFADLRAALAADLSPSSIGTHVRMTKTLFKWAWEHELIDRPVRYGSSFDPPPASAIRKQRASKVRTFTAEQVNALLDAARGPMEAFILLGINCGLGAADIAALRPEHLTGHMLDFPRVKTGISRRSYLWTRTLLAIRRHANGDGLLFVTQRGNPWVRTQVTMKAGTVLKTVQIDSIGTGFGKIRPKGLPGFYGLRRTFRTVADECGDQHAIHLAMGHVVTGMAGIYVDRIDDARLRSVSLHVRRWLRSG